MWRFIVSSKDLCEEFRKTRKPQRINFLSIENRSMFLWNKIKSEKKTETKICYAQINTPYLYPAGIYSLRNRVRGRGPLSLYAQVYRPCANTEPTVCLTVTTVAIGTRIRKTTILAQRQILINQPYPARVLTTNILFNIWNFKNSTLLAWNN